jgi:hypothetical protein
MDSVRFCALSLHSLHIFTALARSFSVCAESYLLFVPASAGEGLKRNLMRDDCLICTPANVVCLLLPTSMFERGD